VRQRWKTNYLIPLTIELVRVCVCVCVSGFLCVGPESSSVHSTVSRTSSCIKFGSAFGGRLTQDQETQTDEVESTATESAQLELLRLSSMLAELQSQVIGMPACNEEESGARATVQPRLFGISVMKNNPFDLELPGSSPVAAKCDDLSDWLEGEVTFSTPVHTPKLVGASCEEKVKSMWADSSPDRDTEQELQGRFELLATPSTSQPSSRRKASRRRRSVSGAVLTDSKTKYVRHKISRERSDEHITAPLLNLMSEALSCLGHDNYQTHPRVSNASELRSDESDDDPCLVWSAKWEKRRGDPGMTKSNSDDSEWSRASSNQDDAPLQHHGRCMKVFQCPSNHSSRQSSPMNSKKRGFLLHRKPEVFD
jgi:hypothetical protein